MRICKSLKQCIIDAVGEDRFIEHIKSMREIDQMYDDIENGIYTNIPRGITHVYKNHQIRCVLQTSQCKIWYDDGVKLYICKVNNTVVCGFPSKKKVINYLRKYYCKLCSYKCGRKRSGIKV